METHGHVIVEEDCAGKRLTTYIEELESYVLSQRGRILCELQEPFLILSLDGAALRILGAQGSSHLQGRRLQTIAMCKNDSSKLIKAGVVCREPHQRAFLSISLNPDGSMRATVVAQMVEINTAHFRLQFLLFQTETVHPLLLEGIVVEKPRQEASASKRSVDRGCDPPDKDIDICIEIGEEHDLLCWAASDSVPHGPARQEHRKAKPK